MLTFTLIIHFSLEKYIVATFCGKMEAWLCHVSFRPSMLTVIKIFSVNLHTRLEFHSRWTFTRCDWPTLCEACRYWLLVKAFILMAKGILSKVQLQLGLLFKRIQIAQAKGFQSEYVCKLSRLLIFLIILQLLQLRNRTGIVQNKLWSYRLRAMQSDAWIYNYEYWYALFEHP